MQEGGFNRTQLVIWGSILGGLIVVSLIPLMIPHYHGEPYDPPREVDFALPRADSGEFRLSDYQGDVVVLYFGYTSCPDICPTTLFDLRRTMEELGDKREDVTVAFITVDPENDTPDKMVDYLRYFDPEFIGLLGSVDALQDVYEQFGVRLLSAEETAPGQGITHTGSLFVIDRSGQLRLRLHGGMRPQDMAKDLSKLLRERGA